MPKRPKPYALFVAACAIATGLYGLLDPVNNWDLIGYIASALHNDGLSGDALHQETYAELRRAIPPERFDLLTTNGAYARGVFADPAALEQQLPFYRIRVLYVWLVGAVGALTQSLAQATYLISAASAAGLAVLAGVLMRRATPGLAWPVTALMLAAALHVSAVPAVARLSTPDALFSLAAFTALVLFPRARTAALLIVALLALIRTDAIVLAALLFVLLLIERDRDPRHYAAIGASAVLYIWINAAYGHHGHLVLLNFAFIPGQRSPYPADLEIVRDLSVYLEVYKAQTLSMLTRWVPWLLVAGGAAVAVERWREGRIGVAGRLTLVAIAYVLAHFAAFPLGAARHYSFALLVCCVHAANQIASTYAKSRS